MYSSSSSESELDEFWQYENNYNRTYGSAFRQNPFYPTMGHPLIYCAQVPQPVCMKQYGRKKPNRFIKAFRWYTEEHVSNQMELLSSKPNKTSFASWLDDKYEKYLEEVQSTNIYNVQMKQAPVVETEKPLNDYFEPNKTKRFRVKSPWRKKRRAKSNETPITLKKSSLGFQYIMQPKDNSAHASECCHSSDTTVKTEFAKKTVVRSQSYSHISLKEQERLDILIPQEGATCQNCGKPEKETHKVLTKDFGCQFPAGGVIRDIEIQCECDAGSVATVETVQVLEKQEVVECKCSKETTKPGIRNNKNKLLDNNSTRNKKMNNDLEQVFCECSIKDEETQCQSTPVTLQSNNDKNDKVNKTCYDETAQTEVNCECSTQDLIKDEQTQYQLDSVKHDEIICCCVSKETQSDSKRVLKKLSRDKICSYACECTKQDNISTASKVPAFTTEAVQTCDYNISLGEDVNEYPLFLKIVCADKN